MAQSDSSGWGRFVDAGQFRLLVTFGTQRTKRWPSVRPPTTWASTWSTTRPTASSARTDGAENREGLHDGFKKALDDPEHQKVLDQLDQELWYRSSEDYAKYARETFQKERALIERLGLLAK